MWLRTLHLASLARVHAYSQIMLLELVIIVIQIDSKNTGYLYKLLEMGRGGEGTGSEG